MTFTDFLTKVENEVLTPLITLLALAAFILFVWGVIQFIQNAGAPDKRKEGQQHIIWGVIGLAIMFGAQAIIAILSNVVKGF